MYDKILNTIIGFSLIGIVGVLARDLVSPPQQTARMAISPTPQMVIAAAKKEINDPPVSCNNTFFNFKKGSTWKYRLTTVFDISNTTPVKQANGSSSQNTEIFTNTITDASESSVTVETRFNSREERKMTTMYCRASGIYGLPIPIVPKEIEQMASAMMPMGIVDSATADSIDFLPKQETLAIDDSWTVNIPIKLKLPIPIGNISIAIKNVVTSKQKKSVVGYGLTDTFGIKTTPEIAGLPIDLGMITSVAKDAGVTYVLGENIGLLKFDLAIPMEKSKGVSIKIDLIEFKEGVSDSGPHVAL